MANINIKPNKVTKKLLSVLPERSCDIIIRRFGLGDDGKKVTLEAIGRDYGITRERVRQIENNALKKIKKSDVFENEQNVFSELENIIDNLGVVVSEKDLLQYLAKKEAEQNHVHFLLVLGDSFEKEKENSQFRTKWHINPEVSSQIQDALRKITKELSKDDLYTEDEINSLLVNKIGNLYSKYQEDKEVLKRWLSLSKEIGRNHFNEWGLAESTNINAKGIRDYAYLSIRQHGSPMHFREVAKAIADNFGKKAHTATCHNELIKDNRFVLVGRGLYALSEWGYTSGVVRDVIKAVLEKEGALRKEEIIEKVLRERYIKENTVVVNLQDPKYFKKNNQDKYIVVK